jgi:hypothetical protein
MDWTTAVRKANILALLASALFCHLSRNQIFRVYDQYDAIKKYVKAIGTNVVANTNTMINDPLRSITVLQTIGILAEVYVYFILKEKYSGLPDKLFKFLHKCQLANHRNALGLSLDLNDEELNHVESFILFYSFVLLNYTEITGLKLFNWNMVIK